MTRRLVMILDWREHLTLAYFALRIMLASWPEEIGMGLTVGVSHAPSREDEECAGSLLRMLGTVGDRINHFEVEEIAKLEVPQPFLLIELGSLEQTLEQVCQSLSRLAAQSLDGRNTVDVITGIDPGLF